MLKTYELEVWVTGRDDEKINIHFETEAESLEEAVQKAKKRHRFIRIIYYKNHKVC